MKRLFLFLSIMGGLVLVYLSGCASAPEEVRISETAPEKPPEWMLNPPESDERYMYFTGSGGSKTGSMMYSDSQRSFMSG